MRPGSIVLRGVLNGHWNWPEPGRLGSTARARCTGWLTLTSSYRQPDSESFWHILDPEAILCAVIANIARYSWARYDRPTVSRQAGSGGSYASPSGLATTTV
jgi:hypothetical protein